MRQRNDSGTTLHISSPIALTIADGETVDYPVAAAGLTAVDHEFVDGAWQPIAEPDAKSRKATAKTDPTEEPTP